MLAVLCAGRASDDAAGKGPSLTAVTRDGADVGLTGDAGPSPADAAPEPDAPNGTASSDGDVAPAAETSATDADVAADSADDATADVPPADGSKLDAGPADRQASDAVAADAPPAETVGAGAVPSDVQVTAQRPK